MKNKSKPPQPCLKCQAVRFGGGIVACCILLMYLSMQWQ